MVGRKSFRRSLTFPIPTHKSVPRRSHPLLDEIHSLKEWSNSIQSQQSTSSSSILSRLDHLHRSLLGDLQQNSVLPDHHAADVIIDDFLRLADAYSSFRSAIVDLKQENSATQSAIRRKDAARIAACFRNQRRTEKEITRIATGITGKTGKWAAADAVGDVVAVTAAVSAAVFRGIAGLSSAAGSRGNCTFRRLSSFSGHRKEEEEEEEEERWRRSAMERLEALEECLGEVESVTDKLFRSLINTRVFLLNVLTPSL